MNSFRPIPEAVQVHGAQFQVGNGQLIHILHVGGIELYGLQVIVFGARIILILECAKTGAPIENVRHLLLLFFEILASQALRLGPCRQSLESFLRIVAHLSEVIAARRTAKSSHNGARPQGVGIFLKNGPGRL